MGAQSVAEAQTGPVRSGHGTVNLALTVGNVECVAGCGLSSLNLKLVPWYR